ncbi:hypothetical protein J3Q64DRAFT_1610756, partial [Phycomyces blakesleeanus]
ISRHINTYIHNISYARISLLNAHQIAMYEATKIHTTYIVNIKLRFGQHLCRVINILLDIKNRQRELTQQLRSQRATEERIKRMLTEHIFEPARIFKEGVSTHRLEDVFIFQKDSIYYDSKDSPHSHFLAFFRMAQLLEHPERRSFNCFPLRRSWPPGYMQIDTR